MIFTGYFARIKEYARMGFKLVSIANQSIQTTGQLATVKFKPLVPGRWIYPWKNDLHNRSDLDQAKSEYLNIYYKECLNKYTPNKLFVEVFSFSKGGDVILLCYEATPEYLGYDGIVDLSKLTAGKDFCHRHLVSDFLRQGGFTCVEMVPYKENKKEEDLFQ